MIPLCAGVASLFAIQAVAHPVVQSSEQTAELQDPLVQYRPISTSSYTPWFDIKDMAISRVSGGYVQQATQLASKLAPGATFRVSDSYVAKSGIAHVYLRQTVNDVDVVNADMNVNFAKDGSILSYGQSFAKGDAPARLSSFNNPLAALRTTKSKLRLPIDGVADATAESNGERSYTFRGTKGCYKAPTAELVYYKTANGKIKPVWSVSTDLWTSWYQTYVDAANPSKIHASFDYANQAKYQVYPWGVMDPTEGSRVTVTDPWDETASEFGWHNDGTTEYKDTRGNNIIAQTNWKATSDYNDEPRPFNEDQEYIYPFDLTETDWKKYGNASTTQMFYMANMYHDLVYHLGFDEAAANYEINNNGQGGKGNDFIVSFTQDGTMKNNAQFMPTPDGSPGRVQMFMFDQSTPNRDCTFDANVLIHELTHGLSNRLTGGGSSASCLRSGQAGGMGEGWSDALANAVAIKAKDTRALNRGVGKWVLNNDKGVRRYLYSTDMQVNPHTYGAVNNLNRVHDIGEVWATALYEMMWNLVEAYPIDDSIRPKFDANGVATNGRFLFMQLVIQGMALQPCNPNFIQARDAILDADKALTNSKNSCTIWKAFAKRGVGANAKMGGFPSRVTESFDLPAGC